MQSQGYPGPQQLMEQALAMRDRFSTLRDELGQVELTGRAGNGQVAVTLRGNGEAVSVRIDPAVVDPRDVPALEQLVLVAIGEAQRAIQAFVQERSRLA